MAATIFWRCRGVVPGSAARPTPDNCLQRNFLVVAARHGPGAASIVSADEAIVTTIQRGTRMTPFPGEQVLPGMPEPPPPPPPEPVLVKGTIKVRLEFEADVAALAKMFPGEYQAARDKVQTSRGYLPWEVGSVFLWDIVDQQVETYVPEIPDALFDRSGFRGEPEIEFEWTEELQRRLDPVES